MLLTLAAALFVLSIVIFVHEVGHFLAAKAVGIYVKTFSIGFGPKLLRRRFGETEYAISALPLGGYVKFAGEWLTEGHEGATGAEIDRVPPEEFPEVAGDPELAAHLENVRKLGLTQRQREEREQGVPLDRLTRHTRKELDELWADDRRIPSARHFRTHPVRHRVLVVAAGPLMNLVLAVAIYVGIFWLQGTPRVLSTTALEEVSEGSPAAEAGLMAGDVVVSLDGEPISSWEAFLESVSDNGGVPMEIGYTRAGASAVTVATPRFDEEAERWILGVYPRVEPKVGKVKKDSPAWRAGLREGDVVLAINDTAVVSYLQIQRTILPRPGKELQIRWSRMGEVFEKPIIPDTEKDLVPGSRTETRTVGRIGIGPFTVMEKMSLPDAIVQGTKATAGMGKEIFLFLSVLVRGQASIDSVGGPLRVGQVAGEMARWGFNSLLFFLAFFSINLCIFNLLPVLPFDGGHLALFAYEGLVRRPVHRRVQEVFMQFGFVLLVLLMIIVISLDAIHIL